jgi:hypothetical protein
VIKRSSQKHWGKNGFSLAVYIYLFGFPGRWRIFLRRTEGHERLCSEKLALTQGVVAEDKSLCFLSSKEVTTCHIERTHGVFLYRCSKTPEINSRSVGDIVFGVIDVPNQVTTTGVVP